MLALLAWAIVAFGLGAWAIVGAIAVAVLLAYEHSIVKPNDLSRLNAAFFTMNGFVSVAFFVFVATDVLTRR
jgi:4-hydroxybenzoate polyprenyltransferase